MKIKSFLRDLPQNLKFDMSFFIASFTTSGSHFSYLEALLKDPPSNLTAASTISLSF